jgi:hypothetical protein
MPCRIGIPVVAIDDGILASQSLGKRSWILGDSASDSKGAGGIEAQPSGGVQFMESQSLVHGRHVSAGRQVGEEQASFCEECPDEAQ